MDSKFSTSFLILILLLLKNHELVSPKCISSEREALLTFKASLTDLSGQRLSSWFGPDCCTWTGVYCDNRTNHVIKIDLRNPNRVLFSDEYRRGCLRGKLHRSLTRLKFLTYLDLSLNDFNGTKIPEFIGELVSLRYLNLSLSSFSGEVPSVLGNLSKLETLDLYAESLSEYNSDEFEFSLYSSNLGWLYGLSSSLSYLNMAYVNLAGVETLFEDIRRVATLKEVRFFNCKIHNLPMSMSSSSPTNLKLLEILDLSINFLSMPIPNWIFGLTSLRKLYLGGNLFHGLIPSGFENLKLLETLDLSDNLGGFEGEIPLVLGDLPRLTNLDLSANALNGLIHEFLDALSRNKDNNNNSSMVYLDLRSNKLVGTLPESLGELKNLQVLDLSSNSFTGSVPSSIGNLASLEKFDLSNNAMDGTISSSLGKLEELVDLNLMMNSWEGVMLKSHFSNLKHLKSFRLTTEPNRSLVLNLPSTWIPPFRLELIHIENCEIGPLFPMWLQVQTKLNSITLKNNGIADVIPRKWFSSVSSEVNYVTITNNGIKGKLPQKLVFPKLKTIDLSSNNFQGPFPQWSTKELIEIRLNENNFSGSLPVDIDVLMPRMNFLYLFRNSFTREIPASICEITDLQILSIRNNRFSGSFPKCWRSSLILFEIDASENNLSGEIPASLGALPSLSILLLNNNAMEGNIPNSLKKCSGLTYIELGGNKLTGEIPREILTLSNLRILNLSRNSMSGSIPENISELSYLETLDLSRNGFSGTIPPSLAAISSLRKLNLSFNKLEGNIPKLLKFQDPYVYIGNELLCGKPLPKKCHKGINRTLLL
ncbi:unnamed protein product [Cochlearia groenlandica]